MERQYSGNVTSNDVSTFIGVEVEHTPAYGMKTLFLTKKPLAEDILEYARIKGCEHIYLGANQSFNPTLPNGTDEEIKYWTNLMKELSKSEMWFTLDYDIKYHEFVTEFCWGEYDRFIPLISVKIPNIKSLNYNACLKIDDSDFRKSNPGVWVHPIHDLQDRRVFTDWSKYTKDEIIS